VRVLALALVIAQVVPGGKGIFNGDFVHETSVSPVHFTGVRGQVAFRVSPGQPPTNRPRGIPYFK